MNLDLEITASANSQFAKTILHRAAGIFAASQREMEDTNAYTALQQAKDEFLSQETHSRRKQRTYGLKHLSVDLGNLIRQRHPKYADDWAPINRWSRDVDQETVVKTLREAETIIGDTVAERTRNATKFELMSEKERGEFLVMQKAKAFLQEQDLTVHVKWERKSPKDDPIDYWATINGISWAFEICELRKTDDPKSHRRVGDPRPHTTVYQELEELSAPLPGAGKTPEERQKEYDKALQAAFNEAVEHGNKPSKLNALNGAKYCLLVHNRHFLYEPSWLEVAYPDHGAIDAVLMLHIDDLSPTKVWEVIPNDGFAKAIKSQNISDLADIAEFKASAQKPINRESIRAAWEAIPELDEAEILQAIKDL